MAGNSISQDLLDAVQSAAQAALTITRQVQPVLRYEFDDMAEARAFQNAIEAGFAHQMRMATAPDSSPVNPHPSGMGYVWEIMGVRVEIITRKVNMNPSGPKGLSDL